MEKLSRDPSSGIQSWDDQCSAGEGKGCRRDGMRLRTPVFEGQGSKVHLIFKMENIGEWYGVGQGHGNITVPWDSVHTGKWKKILVRFFSYLSFACTKDRFL